MTDLTFLGLHVTFASALSSICLRGQMLLHPSYHACIKCSAFWVAQGQEHSSSGGQGIILFAHKWHRPPGHKGMHVTTICAHAHACLLSCLSSGPSQLQAGTNLSDLCAYQLYLIHASAQYSLSSTRLHWRIDIVARHAISEPDCFNVLNARLHPWMPDDRLPLALADKVFMLCRAPTSC